jgi:hypothetical protein
MKKQLTYITLAALSASLILLSACSKSGGDGSSSPQVIDTKPKGLRIGMEYNNNSEFGYPVGCGSGVYSSRIYIFGNSGVSVYGVISSGGDIFLDNSRQVYITQNGLGLGGGHPKGTHVGDNLVVSYGPGDRVTFLDNASYKVDGTSVYVDWSQHHGELFPLTFCGSGSEVFTIKNDGLVLESATSPGFNLTLNMFAH